MKLPNTWRAGTTALLIFAIHGCEAPRPTGIDETSAAAIFLEPDATAGKIVVNHDEWTWTNFGFSQAPDAAQFALSVASWFTDGGLGDFLVYSNNFGLVEDNLATTMTTAGHGWSIVDPVVTPLPALGAFDGVFVGGNDVDNQVLIDYVNAGGNAFVVGGTGRFTAEEEAASWNTFLNAFGLQFGVPFNGVSGILPITSTHPIFDGVSELYQNNGNPISELDPANPNTDILEFSGSIGLYGVFELMATPNTAPTANAGSDQIVECVGAVTSVVLDGSGSTDPEGDELTYTWRSSDGNVIATGVSPEVTLALGVHILTLTVSDGEFTSTDDVEITVADTVAPVIDLTLHEQRLWSHHNKMRLVATVSASDECDPAPVLTVIVSDHKRGHDRSHGESRPDWKVVDNGDGTYGVFIRARRDRHRRRPTWHSDNVGISLNASSWENDRGPKRRVYTITATAVDASGNTSTVEAAVSLDNDDHEKENDHGK